MGHCARVAFGVRSVAGLGRPGVAGVATLALAGTLAAGGSTRDHTELERSDPAENAVLAASPSRIVLDYTTGVLLAPSTVVVRSAQTRPVNASRPTYLADDRRDVLVLPLAETLSNGSYEVAWTTAGPDGHAISGNFGFRVESDTLEVDDTVAATDTAEESAGGRTAPARGALASAATRFVHYAGIAGLLGAVAFRLLVAGALAREGSRQIYQAAVGRAWTIAALSAGAVLASAPFRLWFQAQAFFPGDAAPDWTGLLTSTPWGQGWMLHVGAGLLAALGIAVSRKQGPHGAAWGIASLSALLLPLVPVLSGHAWNTEPRSLAATALYVHVAVTGVWVGGLFCVVFAGLPAVRRHAEGVEGAGLAAMVAAFSRIAVGAVALLAASGTVNAWMHLDVFSQLWTTSWGRTLLVKLAVVAGVMAVGLYNWRVVRPALAESPRPSLLALPAVLELALAAAALAATSWLAVQPLA